MSGQGTLPLTLFSLVLGAGSVFGFLQPGEGSMLSVRDPQSGQILLLEGEEKILQYNHLTVEPGDRLAEISEQNLIYARARSAYIHPLYGPNGQILTCDWPVDHPHHRGIYWAWPEVRFGAEMGDLHALQRVFARPTRDLALTSGSKYAQVEAGSVWEWEDRLPVVRELAVVRAYRRDERGRMIDLEFHFRALEEEISIARRETDAYGGLNVRLARVENQQISFHTDPPDSSVRMSWAELSGNFSGEQETTGVSIFQHPDNPEYPGDWVEYPEINWFQPTFPSAGTRYALTKDQTLILRYRLWVHSGSVDESTHRLIWSEYAGTERLVPASALLMRSQ